MASDLAATPGGTVTLLPGHDRIPVGLGTSMQEALIRAGVLVDSPCDGQGRCGKCRVRISPADAVAPTPHDTITEQDTARGVRLACRLYPTGDDLAVELLTADSSEPRPLDGAAGTPHADVGLAIDLGTTTIVAALVDLETGKKLTTVATLNPQRCFGNDVISRIHRGSTPEGLAQLCAVVRRALDQIARALCDRVGICPERVASITIAGNPTMLQLAAGIDPAPLGVAPFSATYRGGLAEPDSFGLEACGNATAYVPPVVDAFIGADVSAGLLAGSILQAADTVLFVDLGTNGEIVLCCADGWYATSAAAGPTFEGMGLSSGMRAAQGAITSVVLAGDDLQFEVIGNETPRGLCGSGVIDLIAALRSVGMVDETGRLARPGSSLAVPARLLDRLCLRDGQPAFQLAPNVLLTQRDVRQLQLAKGAIRAAIEVVLARAGVTAPERLVAAGAFGSRLGRASAEAVGLFPPGIASYRYAGNTSLDGCARLLVDETARTHLETVAGQIRTLNLADAPDYFDRFTEHMGFGT